VTYAVVVKTITMT